MHHDQDNLILVDAQDRELKPLEKAACHDGAGQRHRAFSLFIFDGEGRLLIQQRSAAKRLWPGFWSNSCCSHPRWGETVPEAAMRRPQEELGLSITNLKSIYKFEYRAEFEDKGTEWELCHVFFARTHDQVQADPAEVSACRFIGFDELNQMLQNNPAELTPWFQMEWRHLQAHYSSHLQDYSKPIPCRRLPDAESAIQG